MSTWLKELWIGLLALLGLAAGGFALRQSGKAAGRAEAEHDAAAEALPVLEEQAAVDTAAKSDEAAELLAHELATHAGLQETEPTPQKIAEFLEEARKP